MIYVVAYDIEDDKRRRLISEILEEYGVRVNYSVFEIEINKKELENLIVKIDKVLKNRDNVRFYNLNKDTMKKSFVIGKEKIIN